MASPRIQFDRGYFLTALGLFIALLAIALMVQGGAVRTHLGDMGVVGLLYAALRSVLSVRVRTGVGAVVGFACLVEFAQYLDAANRLGLGGHPVAQVVLGSTFDAMDLVMYALGGLLILIVEAAIPRETRGNSRPG